MLSDPINLIINLLEEIDFDTTIIPSINNYFNRTDTLVDSVIYLADKYLIDDNGQPVMININKIIDAGYDIFPGETDRFGWLSACIELKRGIIVFG